MDTYVELDTLKLYCIAPSLLKWYVSLFSTSSYLIPIFAQNHDDRPYYSLLKYLRTTDCIDDAEWYQLNLTIHNNEGLWLYPFISLFAGGNWAKDFLLSLPLDLKKTSNPAYLDSNLIATDVTFSLYAIFDRHFALG